MSSHPPGWPRGGPRRGGTHAGRKPVGARPAAGALPSLATDPGARAPAVRLRRGEEGGGEGVGTSEVCGRTSVRVCGRGSECRQLGTRRAGVPVWRRVCARARPWGGGLVSAEAGGRCVESVRAAGWGAVPGTMASEAGLRRVGRQTVLRLPMKWLRQSAWAAGVFIPSPVTPDVERGCRGGC